ncbi:ATP/GTP-binding protein [Nocardiopsis sp. NPDC058631]|uniref:AAA family ATPase n=1 Tax=Nocardiopsis sp. NPDC058631 TaxID=3346566 RepID=UPI0036622B78
MVFPHRRRSGHRKTGERATMLLSFRVENHRSIRDEQQLLLTPVYDDARPQEADWEASTVAGIFGANASGKSNLLDALALMRDTVRWSMSDNEPGAGMRRHAFFLDEESPGEPSAFVIDLKLGGVRYTYGFSIDDDRVVDEWLYGYPQQRKRIYFERQGENFTFGDRAQARLRHIGALTGQNVLFLTVAARAGHKAVQPVYRWFSESLVFAEERRPEPPSWLRGGEASEERLRSLGDLLKSADTGIRSIELQEDGNRTPFRSLRSTGSVGHSLRPDESHRADRSLFVGAFHGGKTAFLSQLADSLSPGSTLLFHHEGTAVERPLMWEEESLGTRALAVLGFEAQRVLETGGVLVVDEIDASLHPYLSARVIALFQDEGQNPAGAQLIFTSHDAALLGRVRGEEVLKRDHIWFVDKDEEGRTSLYPLSDFKPRGDDNRARRYLTGRYGAVPEVDDELFRDALARREPRGTTEAVDGKKESAR